MFRRSHILTAVVVLVAFAALVPSAYAVYGPATPAEATDQGYQDLRSPDARDAKTEPVTQVAQDLRSPDARDAGLPEQAPPDTVVEIREVPGSGFDWGDAGIGAAGILALLSIAGGLALMATSRRRGPEMPAH
jgi:hypothetical protein